MMHKPPLFIDHQARTLFAISVAWLYVLSHMYCSHTRQVAIKEVPLGDAAADSPIAVSFAIQVCPCLRHPIF